MLRGMSCRAADPGQFWPRHPRRSRFRQKL